MTAPSAHVTERELTLAPPTDAGVVTWLEEDDAYAFLTGNPPRHPALPEGIFTGPEWLAAASRHLVGGRRLVAPVVSEHGMRYSFLAFTGGFERFSGLPVRTLRLLGYPFGDRHPLGGVDSDRVGCLLGAALCCVPMTCDALIFDEVIDQDLPLLTAAGGAGFKIRQRRAARSPYLDLGEHCEPDERFARYSKSLRTRLARARKKLTAAGTYSIRVLRPAESEVEAVVARIAEIEHRSWKGANGVGIFSQPASRRFFEDLSRTLAVRRAVQVALLTLDDKIIAYRYGFVSGGVVYDYNFAHLPEFAHLSPGRILLDETIAFAITRGERKIDASRGDLSNPHLLADWTDAAETHSTIWLCPPTVFGRTAYFLSTYGAWLRRVTRGFFAGTR